MKYRKKPVEIRAFRLGFDDIPVWVQESGTFSLHTTNKLLMTHASIETLEGVMRAELGDWIIEGVQGELYPCKHDIFEATYEKVED